MEEKVQYQSEERLMDIKEHLQGLEAKVNSLEHQQAQQQYINIDGLENSGKLPGTPASPAAVHQH